MTPIIFGSSVRGDSHKRHNVEKQDSYLIVDGVHRNDRNSAYYKQLSSDVKMVAVADGHGSDSCPFSKTGSQTAANVFCDIMAEFCAKYQDDMDALRAYLSNEGEVLRVSKAIVSDWERRILEVHKLNRRPAPLTDEGERDEDAIWKQYGTTLLGILLTESFAFFFQLGDGDITYVDKDEVRPVIEGDKILGVETHSISKRDSWKKAITKVVDLQSQSNTPFMYMISTDGMMNSHASEEEFHKTCRDYFALIQNKGASVVEEHLDGWLTETSEQGCGDDITVVFACLG